MTDSNYELIRQVAAIDYSKFCNVQSYLEIKFIVSKTHDNIRFPLPVTCKGEDLTESEVIRMALKHKVTINVTDSKGKKATVLRGATRTIPERLVKFLFGDFTQVYLLAPGQTVESVDIREVREGGKAVCQK